MRKHVQVLIPEKLYNVVLEICKVEPGVETDRLLPEDLIERCLSVSLREHLEQYVFDKQAREVVTLALDAFWEYKKEVWAEFKKKYPDKVYHEDNQEEEE